MKKEIYADRLAKGLCLSCGVKIPQEGHKRCPMCQVLFQRANHKRYEERKAQHLCVRCGKPQDGYYVFCSSCREKMKESGVIRRQQLKADGLCQWCRKPVSNGHALCDDCLRKKREGAREERKWQKSRIIGESRQTLK